MHHIPALASQPVSLMAPLRQAGRALAAWGLRQWQALCAQAERPGRQVPYY
ncbi:hypothetical protein [Curvibacter sp. PAE-UM]|uniref:hypothetical protein n=1 Tax=Curvibacter sp. PAE-UM TaxID=1714344 RepID=UPI000A518370|nr:hypothetical protein [Curvibacter sp. PAE-UM]